MGKGVYEKGCGVGYIEGVLGRVVLDGVWGRVCTRRGVGKGVY